MDFKYYTGTKVIFGRGCISKNASEFRKLGQKALIVTGRQSAKESGALDDVYKAMEEQGITYSLFEDVENNPSLETVANGGEAARSSKADFIVGIGGGSPLDASKAIAVLAANEMEPIRLYENVFKNKPLSVITIPTTAGTGSEVTPYSILTRDDLQTKKSFGNDLMFPVIAFMDAGYTESMSWEISVNTAVDTFSHAVEGYLSRRSTPVSDIYAVEAAGIFGQCINALLAGDFDSTAREKLLYASMLGGVVIVHTGTTIVHGMGYNLTYFMNIPHGRANGYFMKEYLDYNYGYAKNKIDNIIKIIGMKDINEFGSVMDTLLGPAPHSDRNGMEKFTEITMSIRSTSNNIRNVVFSDIMEIYNRVLGG